MKNKKNMYLLVVLIISLFILSGCYMEPDKTTNDLNINGNNGQFKNVITPTPTPTATPAPTIEITATDEGNINWDVFNPVSTAPGSTEEVKPTSNIVSITSTPSAKPTATPQAESETLKSGSEGPRVKELQQRLKELGFYKGTIDGKYGVGTANAVKAFQDANNLNADGLAGKATLAKLFSKNANNATQITVPTKKPAAVTKKPAQTPKPTTRPKASENTYLKVNSSGSDVRVMQNRLIELGYLSGSADGVFGASTEKAIIAFQKAACPYSDGIAGPDTLEKLYSSKAPKSSKVVAVVAKSGASLREGDEGNAVRTMQRRLIELGYLSGAADGSFGPSTKTALIAFQAKNGLNQDGVAGTGTLNRLFADDAIPANGSTGYIPNNIQTNHNNVIVNNFPDNNIINNMPENFIASGTGYTVLQYGTSSSSVASLQQKLKELGYYNGSPDGNYGNGTADAVRAFQARNMLTPDGVAGPTMQRLLFGNINSNNNFSKLQMFDEGDGVRNLQYTLYELGYYQNKISGVYDNATFRAVNEFQQNNDLGVDGVAGAATLGVLYSSYAKPSALTSIKYNTLQLGSKDDAVVQLQGRLVDLGYMVEPISGTYDGTTQNAVITFQTINGLKADGVAGAATQTALYSEAAKRKP